MVSCKDAGKMLDKLMEQYPESEQLEWNRDTDNFDVLRRSDILISDFSGVVFAYWASFSFPSGDIQILTLPFVD